MEATSSTDKYLVANAPVIASWTCPDETDATFFGFKTPETSCQVTVNIRFDAPQKAVFIGLRIPFGLKGVAKKTHLHMFIHPEHILKLTCASSIDDGQVPEPVLNTFRRDGVCSSAEEVLRLEFCLSQPASIIVPKTVPLTPKSKASSNVLGFLQPLSNATAFSLYLPSKDVPVDDLRSLCSSARDGVLASIPNETCLATLYGGKGGKEMARRRPLPESPPSYDDIALLPSPPRPPKGKSNRPGGEPPLKRKRESASGSEDQQDWKASFERQLEWLTKTVESVRKDMDTVTSRDDVVAPLERLQDQLRRVEEETATLRVQLQQVDERQSQKEQLFEQQFSEFKDAMERSLEERLARFEETMQQRFDERLEEGLDEALDDKLDEAIEGAAEAAEMKMDDRLLGFKEELTEHVEDELQNARTVLRGSLSRASIYLELSNDENE